MRLLAKDPAERHESASDVLAALDAVDVTTSVVQPAAAVDGGQALDSLAGGVFVGRHQEMGDLKAALEDTLSGRGRMVTLVGEPGIGKSRIAQELATYAGLRAAQVLWGRCYEEKGMPPYWPWVQAIRSYIRDKEPEQLRSEMGAGAEDIAEIVSDVRERLPGLRTPLALEPEQARFRLFDSITSFLKNAAQRRPLVLFLDDLHWADHPSLLLLEFVARELSGSRLLLIGTYRDMELSRRHPLSLTLGGLTRERLFHRVLLRGLSQEDVDRFIELASGVAPPQGMVEAVTRQTEGNPLFVTEVVRLMVQEGVIGASGLGGTAPMRDSDTWSVRIPDGVREVIGRRLDRLSERCNETLTIASVIGREFTLELLNRLIDDLSDDRLMVVLEEALGARVVEELPHTVDRYQFTHALIQETLAEELSTTRRVRLHARIGEVLGEIYGPDADAHAHAAELAYHFAEAANVTGTEMLVHYSLLAGERALASYAHEDALAHFQLALSALEGQPAEGETAAILYGLGRAQAAALPRHQIQEAVVTLSRAFDYFAETGDVDRAVAIAEYPFYPVAGQRIGDAQLVSSALALVPSDSLAAGRLLSRYGRVVQIEEGDYDSAQEAFGKALTIARREWDAALEMRTLADSANADLYQLLWPECLDKGLQAIELAHRAEEPHAEVLARYSAALAQNSLGDLVGLRSNASALLASAESLRDRWWLASALRVNGFVSRLEGGWQAAREINDRGLALSPVEPRDLCTRALLEYEVGEFEQGETYLERLLELMRAIAPGPGLEYAYPAMTIPIVARITGETDRLEVAASACEIVISSPSATPYTIACARAGLSLLAVHRGNVPAADEQYSALAPHQGTMLTLSMIAVDRLLALLSHTSGEADQAVAHFEDALAFCRKAGYRPELAWTCCDYADTLRERDGEGDRARAITLLDESITISSELGMRPLMEQVLSRREILRE